jgi:LacI family transcriptional regulator
MARPTVNDLAKAAGVSLATIDRVLNARPGVTKKTVLRVNEAIEKIGYVRDVAAANLARQRRYAFVFLLPETPRLFVAALRAAISEAAASPLADRTDLRAITFPAGDPHALVKRLRALDPATTDGLAIFAPETPHVRDAIGHLKEAGVPVVALVSDLPNTDRDHFVGIDNIAAGRTAGLLMGRFLGREGGEVAVLVSSMQARDNVERRLGFDQVIAERFPAVEVLPSLESHDDEATARRVLAGILDRRPGLRGIYSVGPGSSTLIGVLEERSAAGRIATIAHELTSATRAALASGVIDAVISQNVGHIVRSALRVLRAKSDGVDIVQSQERIRIEIILRENAG